MGARKKISAEKRKEALKTMYFAKLQNVPTSPRKMRLVADMIRGMEVNRALGVLKFSSKEAAARVEKLLRSAIARPFPRTQEGRGARRQLPGPRGRDSLYRRHRRQRPDGAGLRHNRPGKAGVRQDKALRTGHRPRLHKGPRREHEPHPRGPAQARPRSGLHA